MLGLSLDSIFCHRVFDLALWGLWFPLLSDFHPKGAVADMYGIMTDRGVTKRACVLVDKEGKVKLAEVYEKGLPDIADLAAKAKGL